MIYLTALTRSLHASSSLMLFAMVWGEILNMVLFIYSLSHRAVQGFVEGSYKRQIDGSRLRGNSSLDSPVLLMAQLQKPTISAIHVVFK